MNAVALAAERPTILVVGDASLLMHGATVPPDVVVAADADAAIEILGRSGGEVALAVLASPAGRPLATGRRLRGVDPQLALALLAPGHEVRATRERLALAPELGEIAVLDADASGEEVVATLRERARENAERRRLRRTLDAMNRHLEPRAGSDVPTAPSVSERYLAALLRHLPEGVVAVDIDGRVVTTNRSAAPLLAVPADEAEGHPLEQVLAIADHGPVSWALQRARAGHTADLDAVTLTGPDGDERLVDVTAAPVTGAGGRVVGVVLLLRDVTEDRRTEERLRELQKAESLATLAGGVAHDFNNLLVSVQSWAGLAAEDDDDPEMVTMALRHIGRAARRAAELARSMLAYAGRGRFQLESTDVNAVIREMTALLHAAISRKVEVRLELAASLPPIVADSTQLRQVVMNLVTNASEALGESVGTITVRTSVREVAVGEVHGHGLPELASGRYVVIEVEDTGAGMDEATLARVFDPFFTTKFTGRGLGLAASHGIVRAHGGGIEVTSDPGQGSTFRVLLPVGSDAP